MLTVYLSKTVLISFVLNKEGKFSIWLDFFNKFKPDSINVFVNDQRIEDDETSLLFSYANADNMPLISRKVESHCSDRELLNIIKDEILSKEIGDAIIILDIDTQTANQFSRKYGVICHSYDRMASQCPLFQEGIDLDLDRGESERDWKQLLVGDNTVPCNSLVIIDRYLFSNDPQKQAIFNLREILDNILPKSAFEWEFNVLIIFDSTKSSCLSFESVCTQINRIKKDLKREYKINIEVLSICRNNENYEKTHNRRIISNFFEVKAEHSLRAFQTERKSLFKQNICLNWGASKGIIVQKHSDIPFKSMKTYLKDVKNIVESLRKQLSPPPYSKNGYSKTSFSSFSHRMIK